MRNLIWISLTIYVLIFNAFGSESKRQTIRLFPGYISKITCDGKLLVSSVGNDVLIRLEPLPQTLGCAVLLKPQASSGRTNLVLETSAGSIQTTLEVRIGSPSGNDLKIKLQGDRT